tara:strand:+ start:319 stop:594 length:276 start_codon:yes stop_codon:yes gene_type:complete
MNEHYVRLIANIILNDSKHKSILCKLSAKHENSKVDLVDVWLPRKKAEVRGGGEIWADPWIIEKKEEELAAEKFEGEVIQLATFDAEGVNG